MYLKLSNRNNSLSVKTISHEVKVLSCVLAPDGGLVVQEREILCKIPW